MFNYVCTVWLKLGTLGYLYEQCAIEQESPEVCELEEQTDVVEHTSTQEPTVSREGEDSDGRIEESDGSDTKFTRGGLRLSFRRKQV